MICVANQSCESALNSHKLCDCVSFTPESTDDDGDGRDDDSSEDNSGNNGGSAGAFGSSHNLNNVDNRVSDE